MSAELAPVASPDARLADLEMRFAFLTRLVFELSQHVEIPYWRRAEYQALLDSVVLGGDRRVKR